MKRYAVATLGLLALAGVQACTDLLTTPENAPSRVPRRVHFNATPAPAQFIVSYKKAKTTVAMRADVKARGGTVVWYHEGAGIGVVSGVSAATAGTLPGVESVQADAIASLDPEQTVEVADATGLVGAASQAAPNTAFFYPRQWHHRAIHADAAWLAGLTGSPSITVAIVDTGIDYNYPDLQGLVDLSRSKSFVPSDDSLVAAFFPGRDPVTDLHFHGTHVASTVSSKAAVVAGVTSRVTLIGVKVLGVNGSGATSGVLQGILWATDHGANVINLSLGSYFQRTGNEAFIQTVNKTLRYANNNGSLIVVSAGNEAIDLDNDGDGMALYCEGANVVCVSATGPTAAAGTNGPWTNVDALASYSNRGTQAIDVAAPGGAASPVWEACSQTSLQIPICRTGIFTVGISGTSMASPHAAGLAALLFGKFPDGSPASIRGILMNDSDDLGTPGRDSSYGVGRINVVKALDLPY